MARKCQHENTAEVDTITTATGRRRNAVQCQECGAIIRDEAGELA